MEFAAVALENPNGALRVARELDPRLRRQRNIQRRTGERPTSASVDRQLWRGRVGHYRDVILRYETEVRELMTAERALEVRSLRVDDGGTWRKGRRGSSEALGSPHWKG